MPEIAPKSRSFVITVEDCPCAPVPNQVRVRSGIDGIERIIRGDVHAEEEPWVSVSERNFWENPDSFALFGRNITIIAEESISDRVSERLNLHRSRISEYLVTPQGSDDGAAVVRATSAGVPVRLAWWMPWPQRVLRDLLDYFLLSPTLEVPIEPFYSLAAAMIDQMPSDLWAWAGETLGEHLFVDRQKRISLSQRWVRQGRYFGIVGDTIDILGNSDLWRELVEMRDRMFITQAPCCFCRHYRYCGGFWTTAGQNGTACSVWRGLMDHLAEEFGNLTTNPDRERMVRPDAPDQEAREDMA